MMGLLPMASFVTGSLLSLVAVLAASLTGAAIYKEADEPVRRAAHA